MASRQLVLEEFRSRGLLQDMTEGAEEHLSEEPRTVYIGFDPTGSSLHIGSLLPVMCLVHAQRAGHTPIALVGGGTGLIGDPSGKTAERQLLNKETAGENAEGIRTQLEHFLDFSVKSNAARIRDNLDWLGGLPLVDFLRDIGKHFSVNQLLAKESVKRRVSDEEMGISFTEFSYALLQSYDFLELYRTEGCTVQMGGSDQWGNITAGIDLVRRDEGQRAYGVVCPLITQASGTKFGKTEEGTIWLDPEMTSPFRFYQYWINVDDTDVIRYLKYFTLFEPGQIEELSHSLKAEPQARAAQRALADDVTRRLHGEAGVTKAQEATRALFGGGVEGLSADDVADIFAEVPSSEIAKQKLAGEGESLVDLLTESNVTSSKGEARRSIEGGGLYVNNVRVSEVSRTLTMDDSIGGRFILIRKGKKHYHLVAIRG